MEAASEDDRTNGVQDLVQDVALQYPRSWIVPANTHSTSVECDTLEWLRGLGTFENPNAEQVFQTLNVGGYGGCPFPLADTESLKTVTRFLTLWIFYDDAIEGLGEAARGVVVDAIRGLPERPPDGNCHWRGWWELGRRCRERMSEDWLNRHAGRFSQWIDSVDLEAVLVKSYRRTREPPPLMQYLKMRIVNIGLYPMIDFIEYECARELPPEFLRDPLRDEIEKAACALVAIQNDLAGLTKDFQGDWLNIVQCAAAEDHTTVVEGVRRVARIHDGFVASFLSLSKLLSAHATPEVRTWLRRLSFIVAGFAEWHFANRRYRRDHRVAHGQRVTIRVQPRLENELLEVGADRSVSGVIDIPGGRGGIAKEAV